MEQLLNQYNTPVLIGQALAALNAKYSRTAGHKSVEALSQGEADVLNLARQQLGWPTITSLAHKYYPLYPSRQLWKRALERCSHYKVRTKTLNIVYLLLTLQTVKTWALKAAYSGKEALNRLVHTTNTISTKSTNRLVQTAGIINIGEEDRDKNPLLRRLPAAGIVT